MKIGILEISHHVPPLSEFCRIANSEENEVTVFTTDEIAGRLEDFNLGKSEYSWFLKKEEESRLSYLKQVEEKCNEEIDFLMVLTIPPSFAFSYPFAFFNPNCKKVLVVHEANSWFRWNFQSGIGRGLLRTINYNLSIPLRKLIFPKYDGIIVLYPPIKDYILKNTDYEEVYTLIDTVYEGYEQLNTDEEVHFTFPGGVHKTKGGAKRILNVFRELFPEFKDKLKLEFLGSMDEGDEYERRILNECKELEEKGYKVNYYTDWVEQETFRKQYLKSDAMLMGIKPRVKEQYIGEIYGTTKTSGTVGDCIKYGKPFIASEEFKITEELQSSTLTYEDESRLKKIIRKLVNNKEKLKRLQSEAIENSKKFKLKKQQERFKKIIKSTKPK